jgi:methanogenic corrinoid protein MtbC1
MEVLLETAPELSPVLPLAASHFDLHANDLLAEVDRSLLCHPRVAELLGGNAPELLPGIHLRHRRFMSAVFHLGDYSMLASQVPWMYRTLRSHGFSYDYFPVKFSAWRDAVMRHLPEESALPVAAAYEWLLSAHPRSVEEAEERRRADADAPTRICREARELIHDLLTGEERDCLVRVVRSVKDAEALKRYYRGPLREAMQEIGSLWERGKITVAQEHLSTSIVGRMMAAMYARVVTERGFTRKKAVVTCVPGDHHEVGARMLADFLELEGFRVWYLGASTPAGEVVETARRESPLLLCLSVTLPCGVMAAREIIRKVRGGGSCGNTKVIVGGHAFGLSCDLWKRVEADGYAEDVDGGIELARTFAMEKAQAYG